MPDPPLPLLITGIAGVAGFNALNYFQSRYQAKVTGIRQQNNWKLSGPGIVACNAEDRDRLENLFQQHRFAAVLNCAGNCALRACELDPELAWRTNVQGVENLLKVLPEKVRLVHLSIDLVFSGRGQGGGNQGDVESNTTDPVTVYGKTMVTAEHLIAQQRPDACILRISLPMGISFNGHAGAIDWIQSRFRNSKPATLYFDEIRTPTYTDCLNRLFHNMLVNDLAGVFHAGGPRRLSLYEIAQIVNRIGGYDPELLMGCPRGDAGPVPPRAGNVAMNSQLLAKELGHNPFSSWPYDDRFVPTDRNWHRDRPSGENGSLEKLKTVLYQNPLRESAND